MALAHGDDVRVVRGMCAVHGGAWHAVERVVCGDVRHGGRGDPAEDLERGAWERERCSRAHREGEAVGGRRGGGGFALVDDVAEEALDDGGADEHARELVVAECGAHDARLERANLRAEAVAADVDVEAAEEFLAAALAAGGDGGEHDHACARPPHGLPLCDPCAQRLGELCVVQPEGDGGRLAAGEHEAVALLELLGAAHGDCTHAVRK